MNKIIDTEFNNIACLNADGTVTVTGNNDYNQTDVGGWTDIIEIAQGQNHIIGLRSDGTVVACGDNKRNQCNTNDWRDIVNISARYNHTIGVKSDGTVVAAGSNERGVCDVEDWTNVISVATGDNHTIGLRKDGTVVATGYDTSEVADWMDIVAVAAGELHILGLKKNGTVVATGDNSSNQCEVSDWSDIVKITAGTTFSAGLKSDGTVVTTTEEAPAEYEYDEFEIYDIYDVSEWKDIVDIAAAHWHIVGLRKDGSVLCAGTDDVVREYEEAYEIKCHMEAAVNGNYVDDRNSIIEVIDGRKFVVEGSWTFSVPVGTEILLYSSHGGNTDSVNLKYGDSIDIAFEEVKDNSAEHPCFSADECRGDIRTESRNNSRRIIRDEAGLYIDIILCNSENNISSIQGRVRHDDTKPYDFTMKFERGNKSLFNDIAGFFMYLAGSVEACEKIHHEAVEVSNIIESTETTEQTDQESDTEHYHNLDEILDSVRRKYYCSEIIARPTISWSEEYLLGHFGVYHMYSNHITISRIFNNEDVTEEMLEYLVYHETIHQEISDHNEEFERRMSLLPGHREIVEQLENYADSVEEKVLDKPNGIMKECQRVVYIDLMSGDNYADCFRSIDGKIMINTDLKMKQPEVKDTSDCFYVFLERGVNEKAENVYWVVGWCEKGKLLKRKKTVRNRKYGDQNYEYQVESEFRYTHILQPEGLFYNIPENQRPESMATEGYVIYDADDQDIAGCIDAIETYCGGFYDIGFDPEVINMEAHVISPARIGELDLSSYNRVFIDNWLCKNEPSFENYMKRAGDKFQAWLLSSALEDYIKANDMIENSFAIFRIIQIAVLTERYELGREYAEKYGHLLEDNKVNRELLKALAL